MIRTYLNVEIASLERVRVARQKMKKRAAFAGAETVAQSEEIADLRAVHKILDGMCKRCELVRTQHLVDDLNLRLQGAADRSYKALETVLETITVSIGDELSERTFAFIPHEKQKFFEQDALFGSAVENAFPSATRDIKDAGNCIAADLHTAAVFHLMRVAERGMRALAKHLHVTVKVGQKAKPEMKCPQCKTVVVSAISAKSKRLPLDYAMWEQVLVALTKKIQSLKNKSKGPARSAEFEFYHGLIIQLEAFKDLWRNEVSHCRGDFDETEALRAHSHVEKFMQKLATRVHE